MSPVLDPARSLHRRKLAFAVGAVLIAGLLLTAIILLRSRSEGGFRWVRLPHSGSLLVVDAYIGKPVEVMDRATILVKSVDRTLGSFNAEVKITNEPDMDITGGVRSRFRDKDSTIEIEATDLGQESVRFNVWSIQH